VTTTEGTKLWITNGSGGGTRILKDFTADAGYPTEFLTVGATNFFVTFVEGRRYLWRTDGTAEGTEKLLNTEGKSLLLDTQAMAEFQGRFYCLAKTDIGSAAALWQSDGTATGTRVVGEVGAQGSTDKFRLLTSAGSKLYFFLNRNNFQVLWASDGTQEGTAPVTSFNAQLFVAESLGSILVFQLRESGGKQVWHRSDGTKEGTYPFADVSEVGSLYYLDPIYKIHAVASGVLYYVVMSNEGDEELWRSDGTATGSKRLKDIRPGVQGSYPRELEVIDGTLYFNADDGIHGGELWQSDGTEAGTRMVADLQRGPLGSSPGFITASGSKLYVHATQQRFGAELHVIDLPKKR
jgi:ELWxxDGT repeat protein